MWTNLCSEAEIRGIPWYALRADRPLWAILVSRIPAKIRPNTNLTMLPRQKSMERHVPGFSPVQCLPKKSGLKKFIFLATTTLTPAVLLRISSEIHAKRKKDLRQNLRKSLNLLAGATRLEPNHLQIRHGFVRSGKH